MNIAVFIIFVVVNLISYFIGREEGFIAGMKKAKRLFDEACDEVMKEIEDEHRNEK